MKRLFILIVLTIGHSTLFAQSNGAVPSLTVVVALVILLGLFASMFIADSVVKVEAHSNHIDEERIGIIPSLREMFSKSLPGHLAKESTVQLNKGFDLNIEGDASLVYIDRKINRYAVKAGNFRGIFPIPKMQVAIGDVVRAGQELFFDKSAPRIKYVAPVSGEVIDIRRGEKRSIMEVVILADSNQEYEPLPEFSLEDSSREDLRSYLQFAGVWNIFNQRPFDVIASSEEDPRDIFVSAFNSGPLSADFEFLFANEIETLNKGFEVLKRLTDGQVYLGLNGAKKSSIFNDILGVVKTYFMGQHPVGNVGVQIHHTKAIRSGDVVWTVNMHDVLLLGRIFTEGRYNAKRSIALTGSSLEQGAYVETYPGANIKEILGDQGLHGNERIISGNVLSGNAVTEDGFLDYYSDQLTVIPEGDHYELLGWINPFLSVPSKSPTILSSLVPDIKHEVNTNTNGEKRAFVVSGEYESVLPMDIYLQHLLRAILSKEVERMEGLGLLELTEEDVALCEYVCTSKMPVQKIIREGLDYLRKQ